MKKSIFTLFLIATLVIALTACAGGAPTPGDQAGETQPTTTTPAPTTAPAADRITAAEAEDIALNHAGLSRDAVRFDRTELDKDDGRWEYEIEFYADGWEYDYDIHAETGAILRSEKEQEKPTPKPDPKPTEPTTAPTADRITAAEAEDIALNHAGLSRDAVRFDRTELDKDDGRWEYEIEFYADGWEYSYDIHAETGKILSYDKEIWD